MSLYSENSFSGVGRPVPESKSGKRMLPGRSTARWKSASKAALGIIAVLPALCQTTINLGDQGHNVDFSTFTFTRPISVGGTLPASCQVGQLFFNSAAVAGANLYGCTAINSWTALTAAPSGGSGTSGTTGNGIGAPSPTSVSFGNQIIATTSPAQPVLLSNTGTGPLSITGISLGGTNVADFSQGNNCGSTLATGASCTIALTFTPSTTGAESATLTITDNGVASPHTVSLTGTGGSAGGSTGPTISPAAPSTAVGQPLTLTANSSVSWSLAPGSVGTLTGSGTTATYTPPATMTPATNYGGCPVSPSDSIFNTRIDNLPVHSQSATWMNSFIAPVTFLVSWGTNIIDNSVNTTSLFFHYTTNYNGNFQLLTGMDRHREGGSLTQDSMNDHHMLQMNKQTCQFTETYQDGIPVVGCPTCNAASGYQYAAKSYTMPAQGTTDAAGLPLAGVSVHMGEVKAGVIKHAMRFTLCTGCINSQAILWPATTANGSTTPTAPPMGARFRLKKSVVTTGISAVNLTSGGSGYTTSPAVTFTGCGTAPVATALISGGSVTSVALSNPGANCINPTISFGGPGTGSAATLNVFSPIAQVILTALQQYGMFLADNGMSGQIETDADMNHDQTIVDAMNEIANAKLGANAFEVVDESSLMVSPTSFQVNPNNGYVVPDSFAVVTATDGQNNKTTLPIALQPVLVGVPYTRMLILAGMSGYQLQSWVTGSANQNVTWTLASGPGSITAGGVYTPPASVSTPTDVVLTATSAADSSANTKIFLTVVPSGTNPTNSIRIDIGSGSSFTDSLGNVWLADALGHDSGSYSPQLDNYPTNIWNNMTDQQLWWTMFYTWGDDIQYGPFIVPNGNYKVGFGMAKAGCTGTFDETAVFDNGLVWGPVVLEANSQYLHFDMAKQVNSACHVPYTAYVPAQVTNNLLFATVRSTGGNNSHSVPSLFALSVLPDATTPTISIDSNYSNGMRAGSVAQMYAIGWYMSNTVTWSVTGGGSIDQTGLYTAPASLSSATTVTITATSTVNSSISNSVQVTVIP